MPHSADHSAIGALVRRRREERSLSMDALARAAQVGRTSLHRIENGSPHRPVPAKLARVLTFLDIAPEEVAALVQDAGLRDELTDWMQRNQDVDLALSHLDSGDRPKIKGRPDLVLYHPDGTVIYLEIKHQGDAPDTQRHALIKAASQAGFMVMTPTD